MPLTRVRSSRSLYGPLASRSAMMASALLGPIPGSSASNSALASLILIGSTFNPSSASAGRLHANHSAAVRVANQCLPERYAWTGLAENLVMDSNSLVSTSRGSSKERQWIDQSTFTALAYNLPSCVHDHVSRIA